MNYYRRYVGDYQRKTMRLDPTDHGVYDLMLDYYYAEESPLPLELDDIHAICKAIKPEHRRSVDKVLRLYFVRQADGYHNKRADEEIAVSKKARDNGGKGGRPKTGSITGTITDNETGEITETVTGSITGMGGGKGGGSVHPPTTNHQPPASNPQPPPTNRQPRSTALRRAALAPPTNATWLAYEGAYENRYQVKPLRNAKVNGMLASLLQRLPMAEAPEVAAFYVGHNRSIYVGAKHAVDLLLRDCEGLRTEWATGKSVTTTEAQQADRTQANFNAFAPLIAEAQERERKIANGE